MAHEVLKLLNLVPKLLTNIQTQIRDFRHHQWWPNRRRSGVEIYAVTVFSHRLFQNPLLLAIILTKLMPWVSVGQWCAFGATLVRWWLARIWLNFDQNMSNWTLFTKNFQLGRFCRKLILDMGWALFGRKSSRLLLPQWWLSALELENPFYLHALTRFFGSDDFFSSSISFREIMIMSFRFDLC